MKTKTFIAWVANDMPINDIFYFHKFVYNDPETAELRIATEVYKRKGKKSDWGEESWPPKKIKITVEEI